ncbi:hypothetical protein Goshw_022710 [Gossypium schwendimanii]|uniref:Uncharacterized protein n=1 Tax=Gossypium schwendimanii TaxID=34291 RepID=A0A7J9LQB5_GOSSC|nr:hypothetical protein [Gossypium schwendimanii]
MGSLYIDANLLSREIPDCWNHRFLNYLDLANNNLTRKIPLSLLHKDLRVLNLRKNSMFGELPSTLRNSTSLFILDLSESHFSGSVPARISDKLSKLIKLDLSHNNISGVIPPCFRNLSAMAIKTKTNSELVSWPIIGHSFFLRALLMIKEREDEYGTTLGLVTSMNLSANSLIEEMSKEIGSLVALRSLN